MNCDRARRLFVTEYSVNEARVAYGAPGSRAVLEHFSNCVRCRQAVWNFERDRRLIKAAFEQLPLRADFTKQVLGRIG